MDKLHVYKLLFEIKNENNINVNEDVKRLASIKDEDIPIDILMKIHKYHSIPSIETIEYLHEGCKNNRIYRRLVNENQSVDEKAIALSSFLNQCMPRIKKLTENIERKAYIEDLNLKLIAISLNSYICNNDENAINEAFEITRNRLKSFYRSENK